MTELVDAPSRVTEVREQARASADGSNAHSLLRNLIENEPSLQAFRESMKMTVSTTVAPWITELKRFIKNTVVEADQRLWAMGFMTDTCYGVFRDVFKEALRDLEEVVGEEALNELKLPKTIASIAHAKVESGVIWRPPTHERKATVDELAELQRAAYAKMRAMEDASTEFDKLSAHVDAAWMPYLVERLGELEGERGTELLCATLPRVVHSLLPKFNKIYRATGEGVVRGEEGYAEFINRETAAFGEVNKREKPKQPTQSLRKLLELSGRAEEPFDDLMRAVAEAANEGRDGGVSPGGVLWERAPLKKVARIVEKIFFDPQQRGKVTVPCSWAL